MEMAKEALGIRASLDQFVQGFRPFEEAQVHFLCPLSLRA